MQGKHSQARKSFLETKFEEVIKMNPHENVEVRFFMSTIFVFQMSLIIARIDDCSKVEDINLRSN